MPTKTTFDWMRQQLNGFHDWNDEDCVRILKTSVIASCMASPHATAFSA